MVFLIPTPITTTKRSIPTGTRCSARWRNTASRRVMNVGCDMESSRTGIALGKQYDFLYSSVGVHPHSGQEIDDGSLAELAQLSQAEKVCAIGEIAWITTTTSAPGRSSSLPLERQLQLARELDLPGDHPQPGGCERHPGAAEKVPAPRGSSTAFPARWRPPRRY